MYLVNPEGEFAEYFGQSKKAEEVAARILTHMHNYKGAAAKS